MKTTRSTVTLSVEATALYRLIRLYGHETYMHSDIVARVGEIVRRGDVDAWALAIGVRSLVGERPAAHMAAAIWQ